MCSASLISVRCAADLWMPAVVLTGPDLTGRRRCFAHMQHGHIHCRISFKGQVIGKHLVNNNSKGVKIALRDGAG